MSRSQDSLEEENLRLQRELAQASRATETLTKASSRFAAELDLPTMTVPTIVSPRHGDRALQVGWSAP